MTDGLQHWSKTLGLTARLVAGYMLVAAFTLTAAAVFLHEQLHHGFEVEDAELLSDHVATLRHEVDQHPLNLEEAAETVRSTAANRSLEKYYGRLVDSDGQTLVETPGFSGLGLGLNTFPPRVGPDQKITQVYRATSASGFPVFFASATVSRGKDGLPLQYYVALDITHVDQWMSQFRLQLAIVVVGGSIFSGILAWLMTRRGLKPLRNITEVMQRVGAGGLGERVGKNPWPRELAHMAGAFDIMLNRLSEAFQRLSQFSADAAHEFRTPLNNLMISTSILLTQNREGEEYRQAMVANLSEFERLKRMVDSLLFIARADNAETVLHRTNVDAAVMAANVADYFSALAEERGVQIHCEGSGRAAADETLLRMALANLVSNALRHTPEGGRIEIGVLQKSQHLHLTVSDTGCGIPAVHLGRIFDRFYRIDAARTNTELVTGSGLGLALVKTVIALHGGTVDVTSKEKEGTVFHLQIPITPASH